MYRCSECGSEFSQWTGQCRVCQQWNCMQEFTLLPEPPASAASGASAAAKVLRGGTAAAARAAGSSSSRRSVTSKDMSAMQASASYDDDMAGPVDYSGPDFDSFDEGGVMYDRQQQYGGSSGSAGGRAGGYSSGWITTDDSAPAMPQRLSDISVSAAQLRLPLLGATGAEVSRVLGGGLVPGSLVLVGGEPGTGKSTLLLQVAGLVAHACASGVEGSATVGQQQQQVRHSGAAAAEAAVDDDDEDLPLAARMAAASSGTTSSSSSSSSSQIFEASSTSWLDEAADAAGAGGGVLLPPGYGGRPVLYITAEESRDQVWERARRLGLLRPLSSSSSSSASDAAAGSPPDVRLLVENRVERIAAAIIEMAPAAVVVDSIQTVALRDLPHCPGTVTQVRESASCLLHVAKQMGCATFLVGHVTKAGNVAGPKHLEHMVDVVLYLQGAAGAGGAGARQGGLRLLRAAKNRHGRVGEVGLFEMKGGGLAAVKDAAALFLPSTAAAAEAAADASSGSSSELVGTAIGVVLDGIRPLPLEIQALATPRVQDSPASRAAGNDADAESSYDEGDSEADPFLADDDSGDAGYHEEAEEGSGSSGLSDEGDDEGDDDSGFGATLTRIRGRDRVDVAGQCRELAPLYRHYVGLADKPRMAMLLELLTKHTPIKAHLYNLFLNVVSGIRIPPGETSTDLAVLAAVASSVANVPLPPGTALLGEVGLRGELQQVANLELRLLELSKLGFSRVLVPAAGGPLALGPAELGGMAVSRQHSLAGALSELFGEGALAKAGWYRKKKEEWQGGREAGQERGGRGGGGGGGGGGSRRRSRAASNGSADGGSSGGLEEGKQPRTRGSRRR
ncbi:hypothetical protein OEZ85_012579 [Tetradesmus obliquus]|uniref:AAA+ ATPase domain-containing protein n=1 Tax=Tetradesmus obliquus TaxID=3088 RepID=A0ABY8U368_TETOB|nr:hypothetical protein OEZ85_012579 [Tetradesmus obliquus]